MKKTKPKIGIYSGSFDPVHLGHITFALQAIEQAALNKVYFLPERVPRNKITFEHFGHRVAMIKRAIKPHNKLSILELDDKTFSIQKTLPQLEKRFPKADLVFLFGSDKISGIMNWPNAQRLLKTSEIVIGLRQDASLLSLVQATNNWPKQPLKVINSYWPALISTDIRRSLSQGEEVKGLAKSVAKYINRNWLYVSSR